MSERIQKYLAQQGWGSRREIEKWLVDGRIRSHKTVCNLGDRVRPGDILFVNGQEVKVKSARTATRVLLYNKPAGEICTHKDPSSRTTIFESLPSVRNGRWISVGRLDVGTTGLILISNDGNLVNRLMHPSSVVSRVYICRVRGNVSDSILHQLKQGVKSKKDVLKFNHIKRLKQSKGVNCWFRVTLSSGKNREIHRAWGSVGYQVSRLKRIQYGPVKLPMDLKPGNWRELGAAKVNQLHLVGELPAAKIFS